MSDIQFVEIDDTVLENELIQGYEQATGEILYPGDEKRTFLLNLLPVIVGLKNDINDTGKQNLLRYARGENLDALGEFYSTIRLSAQKAITILKFALSATQLNDVTVPIGTRATVDGDIYFATTETLIILAGQTFGSVPAESTSPGEKYNNYISGQIKIIVDPIPFISSVENTTTTSGGSDIEIDDDYRARIRLAPESFSVAGPSGAYEYFARASDENISDISVTSPTPGAVNIVVLMENGEMPSQAILDKVNAAVNARDKRPLTDNVTVEAPSEINYDITLTYYISNDKQTEEEIIRSAIEDVNGSIDQYVSWQQSELGREINPDELRRRMLETGVYRITLTSPIYTTINADEVAKLNVKLITYGGLI